MSGGECIRRLRDGIGQSPPLPGVAAAFRDSAGRLRLRPKAAERWSLPFGTIEPGETPEESVVREVPEETDLDVVPVELLGVFVGTSFRHTVPNGDEVERTVVAVRRAPTGRGERAP